MENIPACEIKSSNLEGCFTLKEWDADDADFQSRITAVLFLSIEHQNIFLLILVTSQLGIGTRIKRIFNRGLPLLFDRDDEFLNRNLTSKTPKHKKIFKGKVP